MLPWYWDYMQAASQTSGMEREAPEAKTEELKRTTSVTRREELGEHDGSEDGT